MTPIPLRHRTRRNNPAVIECNAASYSRFSSDKQDGKSIEDQQRMCREWAQHEGLNITREYEFADRAVSGTKLRRMGLDKLRAAAQRREFNVLYFHSLSRLGRESVITFPMLKELVYVHRVRVISITEVLDTIRPQWEMLAAILLLQHEQHLKQLSVDVHRGQVGTVLARFSVGDFRLGYQSGPPHLNWLGFV